MNTKKTHRLLVLLALLLVIVAAVGVHPASSRRSLLEPLNCEDLLRPKNQTLPVPPAAGVGRKYRKPPPPDSKPTIRVCGSFSPPGTHG
ncbi:hypothetical protein LINPERPRIM_LOCUS14182 [Linum perenne]